MIDRDEFAKSCQFVMPYGKHKGTHLARIASSDEGLLYLDWLIGQNLKPGDVKDHILVFLSHEAISRRLTALTEDR